VAYSISDGNGFYVTKPDGKTFEFIESDGRLYYLDTHSNTNGKEIVLLSTVADKKQNYTNEDYLRAVRAGELQINIGLPSTKEFIRIVSERLLNNCPVTKADIVAAEDIFGPELGCLKGKTTRRKPAMVRQIVEMLPPEIMSRYRNVTLCIDIMYVNKIPMIDSLSRNIKFGTVEDVSN
jgi:hypothetical protein